MVKLTIDKASIKRDVFKWHKMSKTYKDCLNRAARILIAFLILCKESSCWEQVFLNYEFVECEKYCKNHGTWNLMGI